LTRLPTRSATSPSHSQNKANQCVGQTATNKTWLNYPTATPGTTSYAANALNQYNAVGAVTRFRAHLRGKDDGMTTLALGIANNRMHCHRNHEMVQPGYSYYAPVQTGCASCGY
jgi:hypothetical protein